MTSEELRQDLERRKRNVLCEDQKAVERYNEMLGKEHLRDGIECPVCKNRGWIRSLRIDDEGWSHVYMSECPNCTQKRQKVRNAQEAGLEADYGLKFEQYRSKEDWQRMAKEKAQAYAIHPSGWFVCVGQVGSGKTMLASCVANELLRRGKVVRMKSWPEVVRYTSADYYKEKETLRQYQEVEVLYLDDLYKGCPTDREKMLAYEILNYRYHNGKPTIITSEKLPDEMIEIDEAIWSRISERSSQGTLITIGKDTSKDQRRK